MDVFDALADRTRRTLLTQIAERPARVVDLAAAHDVSRPAISRHLRILGDAGLVRAVDAGRERWYSLDATPLHDVAELVGALRRADGRLRRRGEAPLSLQHLDALATEVHRTRRERRSSSSSSEGATRPDQEQSA